MPLLKDIEGEKPLETCYTKPQLDYQSIIESCGIQDVNIQKALEQNQEASTKFREQLSILKDLKKEEQQKSDYLDELNLALDRNLQKLSKGFEKVTTLNKKLKLVLNDISQLTLKLQNVSDDFTKKINQKEDELKQLYSQFEGDTLSSILNDLNTELLSVQDKRVELERTYEQLKQFSSEGNVYKRPEIFLGDAPNQVEVEGIERKLTNKKRNIEFLTAEYNRKMEMLKKFS